MSIAKKHAVVTGGGRGIGLAVAKLLKEHGARVSVISRTAGAKDGSPFFAARADVGDEAQVRAAFAACHEANGPVTILVNNSGIAESAPVARTHVDLWNRTIATNLTGTFLCTREALPDMIDAKWGRIVNVASTAGLMGGAYIAAYCASKHGVVGFTRALAEEFAKTDITANAICPGYTDTEMMQRSVANITAKTGRSEEATRGLLARGNPEGRIATVDEVAHEILTLILGEQTGLALVIPTPSS